jgi:TerC family integral membrane protein
MTSPRVRTVCVALLGQLTKLEEEIGELDFNGFSAFVDKLEVECDIEDKQSIFAMIDKDGGGTIDGFELKSAIRNSGAIAGMYKESLTTFGYLVAATFAFDLGIYAFKGSEAAFDFLTAYFVEDSLSVDNLFVFLLLFRYFKVPPQLVDICLNYGITGSIVLRGVFIFAGLAAASVFAPVLLGFSVFLIASSYSMLAGGEEEDEEDDAPPEIVTGLLDKLPMTGTFEGEKFFLNTPDGLRATQLTGTLVCIALCDVLFAVDSIPAVLGVTSDPFVVYTSNIAAVVGLRSLYQLLSIAVSDLVYLEKAVAIVLGFVGVKLGAEVLGVEVSSALSLGVIVATLGGGVGLSLLASDEAKAEYDPSPTGSVIKFISNIIGGTGDKGS